MSSGTDRIPRTPTRTRRAIEGIGLTFVPYTGAIKDVDLHIFNLAMGHLLELGHPDQAVDSVISFRGFNNTGSITFDESHNEFDLGNSNLTTTGDAALGRVDVDTLRLNNNVISDSTGTISFDNEILDTAGHAMLFGSTGTAVDTVLTFRGFNNTGTLTYDESSNEFEFDDSSITTTGVGTFGSISISSLTLTGTLQAEQVTSTDDITMQGHLFTVGSTGQAVDTIFRFLGFNNSADFSFDESRNTFMLSDSANFETAGDGVFGKLIVDTLDLDGNIISDSTGTISFDDDHLTTTGNITASGSTVTAEQVTSTHDITMQGWTLNLGTASANDIIINFFGTANSSAITFDISHNSFVLSNSANFKTLGVGEFSRAIIGTIDMATNVITDSTGTISFDDENLTTTGGITAGALVNTKGRIVNTTRIIAGQSPYTMLVTDHTIFCDTDAGAITVNLLAGVNGTVHRIINCGSSNNNLTITPDGVELLLGANNNFTLLDGEVLTIVYETTEGWW